MTASPADAASPPPPVFIEASASRRISSSHSPAPIGSPRISPLLAVCGLCGGAGTTTLSYLIARLAVARLSRHVLVCDTGGPTGGLAAYADVDCPRTVTELADELAHGQPTRGSIYAVDEAASGPGRELRIIATGPRLAGSYEPSEVGSLLAMARGDDAHALTVVDCGTLQRAADRIALSAASHIAWVLPATPSGVRRGARVLASIGHGLTGREVVVARRVRQEPNARLGTLKALAESRRASLVLIPHLPGVLESPAAALQGAAAGLEAILAALAR